MFYFKKDELVALHLKPKKEALENFNQKPKFGGTEFSEPYLQRLEKVSGKLISLEMEAHIFRILNF
jgi:hypothetical protein